MNAVIPFALGLGDLLQWIGLALSPLLLAPFATIIMGESATRFLTPLANGIDSVSRVLWRLAGWLVMFMAAAMLTNVLMRYVYGVSFGWARDLWIYAFAGCFMLASAGALQQNGHVRVDILFSRFDVKGRAIVDLLGAYIFLFPLMILILWSYAPQLANAWGAASGRLELSRETDGLPLSFLFKSLVPVFAATMLAQGWSNAYRAAATLAGLNVAAPSLADNSEPHA